MQRGGLALLVAVLVVAATPSAASAQSPVEGSIERLYRAYFLRAPDRAGLTYWVGRFSDGAPLPAISEGFARSPEFVDRYGRLGDGAFVDLVYRNVLQRSPDATGRGYWVQQLAERRRSRGGVMVGFSESPEFVRRTGTTPPGAPRSPLALGSPVLRQTPSSPRVFDNADPEVLVAGGTTYVFGSTNNRRVPVREVTSLQGSLAQSQTDWARSPGEAMPTLPGWVDRGEPEIWAPSVIPIDGRYVMYFGAARAGAVDEANDQCIGRASASHPAGPYVPEATALYCGLPAEPGSNPWGRGALDPEVIRTPRGELFMVVALSRTEANIATVPLDAGGRVASAPVTLARQAFGWHDGTDDDTLGPTFLENPSLIFEPETGTYLLFYSAGRWSTSRYVTGMGRCSSPVGPCRLDSRGPFLVNGNGRTGVGGLTAFRDERGIMRVAYASWTAGREHQVGSVGQFKRQTHFDTLVVSATTDPAAQTVRLAPVS